MVHKPSLLLVAAAALIMTGCPSDDASAPPVTSSSTGTIVYLADQDIVGVFELFMATSGTKLNPPLPFGRTVQSFALTPDASAVVYIADQDQDDVFELYRVSLAKPGESTKLNPNLAPGQNVVEFAVTPDATAVVYIADQTTNEVFELFRTVLATRDNSKLNPPYDVPPKTGQDVDAFVILPDNSGVVYRADQDTDGVSELYRELFSTPGTTTPAISGVLVFGQNVKDFAATPDSQNVVYIANRPISLDQLFIVPVGGGASIQLNGVSPPLNPNRNVTGFAVTPDGLAVVYRADQNIDQVFELYRTVIATLTNSKVNPDLTLGKNIASFGVIPDSSGVVYIADQNAIGVFELFRSVFSGGPPTVPLNPPFTVPPFSGTEDVEDFALMPNGTGVVYRADQNTNDVKEIYSVVFGFPGSTRLNPPLAMGQNVVTYTVSPDSTSAIYRANQDNNLIIELYRTAISSPGTSTKLNAPLVVGETVKDFAVR